MSFIRREFRRTVAPKSCTSCAVPRNSKNSRYSSSRAWESYRAAREREGELIGARDEVEDDEIGDQEPAALPLSKTSATATLLEGRGGDKEDDWCGDVGDEETAIPPTNTIATHCTSMRPSKAGDSSSSGDGSGEETPVMLKEVMAASSPKESTLDSPPLPSLLLNCPSPNWSAIDDMGTPPAMFASPFTGAFPPTSPCMYSRPSAHDHGRCLHPRDPPCLLPSCRATRSRSAMGWSPSVSACCGAGGGGIWWRGASSERARGPSLHEMGSDRSPGCGGVSGEGAV
ncbi:unnamed protein product [Vitrella brassicaformis CCMP3155]|uniref:Uncharacterized protein n=1 Tax=Vitrella brassicaformis (strain CCMP3155) TaxID=1169540 RepID=A0A0G4GZB4_VITBC|nr:unnamed protein product [Vitrella brassicaformis CCMP3155]|eukprot:CEM36596.1 unnamed protein product [Vitrella brassicaformis CCMP3155]